MLINEVIDTLLDNKLIFEVPMEQKRELLAKIGIDSSGFDNMAINQAVKQAVMNGTITQEQLLSILGLKSIHDFNHIMWLRSRARADELDKQQKQNKPRIESIRELGDGSWTAIVVFPNGERTGYSRRNKHELETFLKNRFK